MTGVRLASASGFDAEDAAVTRRNAHKRARWALGWPRNPYAGPHAPLPRITLYRRAKRDQSALQRLTERVTP